LQSQWYHANTFLSLKEENLYITAKMTQKWLVPKVSIIKRFHCMLSLHYYSTKLMMPLFVGLWFGLFRQLQ